METIIKTTQLNRVYKTYRKPSGFWNSIKGFWHRDYFERVALAPINLEIKRGQIVGLVGANGAGKTTLLKLLSGLIHPTSGEARVLGFTPWERKEGFLKNISILLGQKNQLWWDIPSADSFELLMDIYDLDKSKARKRYEDLASLLRCDELLHVPLRRLSLGERMKMEIIGSLLHQPKVLFLDEPTIGLDIVAQTTIREFLASYVKEHNPTVILTSHYMDDIAKLAERLLLIQKGEIVYDGTVQQFTKKAEPKKTLIVSFIEPPKEAVSVGKDFHIPAGAMTWSAEIHAGELPKVMKQVFDKTGVGEIKLEESNFEDVIREFMQKRS